MTREAWREQQLEYATVALRYSLIDALIQTSTGRVIEGSKVSEIGQGLAAPYPAKTACNWRLQP